MKYKLKDLRKSIRVEKYFNDMPFDEFIKIVNLNVTLEDIESWKFTGLSNVSFYRDVCKCSVSEKN